MSSYNGFTDAQRDKAYRWFMDEIKAGRRVKRPTVCCACGQKEGLLEFHSEDYSEPYGAHIGAWGLCYRCHMMIHCRFRNKKAWTKYRQAVAAGITFEPLHTRNFPLFIRQSIEGTAPVKMTQAQPRKDVLAMIDPT